MRAWMGGEKKKLIGIRQFHRLTPASTQPHSRRYIEVRSWKTVRNIFSLSISGYDEASHEHKRTLSRQKSLTNPWGWTVVVVALSFLRKNHFALISSAREISRRREQLHRQIERKNFRLSTFVSGALLNLVYWRATVEGKATKAIKG